MARKGLAWISQRILIRKKRVQRELSLALIGSLLYGIINRFNEQILYPGWLEYYIYIPIIILGVVVLGRNKKDSIDPFVLFWLFRFILSVFLFYVPAMCLFVIGNHLYTRNSHPKTQFIQHVENHGNLIIFELAGERVKYRGKTLQPHLNDYHAHTKWGGKFIYNDGLFGTYVVQRFELHEIK